MNNSVVSLVGPDDGVRRASVFTTDHRLPTLYMPQYVTTQGVVDTCGDAVSVTFEVRDKYISAMNHLVLSIELPEIKGCGRVCYVPYVGYKLIQHISINSASDTIWETSGEELFDSCLDNERVLELSGNSRELNDLSTGSSPNDVIKEAACVHAYIKTPFDADSTFSTLKLSDCKVTVTVTLNPIACVLVHDEAFDMDSFASEFPYALELSFLGYMVKNLYPRPAFVETPRRRVEQLSHTTCVLTDVHACTSLTVYTKPVFSGMDNRFIAYPGFQQSEGDFIMAFVERLLEDMVIVARDYPEGFPDTAEIVEVPESGLVSIQDTDVFVRIDAVPAGMRVFLHTNILVFATRKNSIVYNMSKKFSAITGVYSASTQRIRFTGAVHSVTIGDASVPVSIWSCQRNVYHGDNRSEDARAKDLFVADPFLKGIDFKNKTDVISRMDVRFGNEVLYSETSPVSRVFSEILGKTPGVRTLQFNFTPNTFFAPTALNSNVARGKDKISVRINTAPMDMHNPLMYVPRHMVVVCRELYKISYEGGISVEKVTSQ
ncbi:putative rifampin resistance protein [Parapoxvirus red deer/HL953]|uniref:62 kDa protein n=1 Tax=Parapoxvirus red deer/HL953 TaxID=1579460 RepID=A0A0A7MET6_9POXV|nr:putative rifampin resistance protein [Parapoxvirus red deer/HL953]AIZ77326.1 putative rifampin resistance protein [Parapoxvirus red deer/HL953]